MSSMFLIQHYEASSSDVSSIVFSSIPSTYNDLYIVASLKTTTGTSGWYDILWRPNGDTGNFGARMVYGSGTSVTNLQETSLNTRVSSAASTATSVFGSSTVYIADYTSTNPKSVIIDTISENNSSQAFQGVQSGLYSGTSGISSFTLVALSGNIARYSSVTVYGVLRGSSGGVSVS